MNNNMKILKNIKYILNNSYLYKPLIFNYIISKLKKRYHKFIYSIYPFTFNFN